MADTTTETLVRQAKSPQEAMLAIAQALDRIEAHLTQPTVQWGEWSQPLADTVDYLTRGEGIDPNAGYQAVIADEHAAQITGDETYTEVVIPPASEERKEARRMFEQQRLRLAEFLQDDSEDWNEKYAIGGPRWLYYGNRDLVMSLPDDTRRMMVEDVEIDSPAEAQEIARDILKFRGETGPTSVAMGTDIVGRPGDSVR